uniref:SFRICE_027205 n=1 Tax=Spodoptera frugiperda TaxID=7108 RepID=A0A2H1VUN5_SPOFR
MFFIRKDACYGWLPYYRILDLRIFLAQLHSLVSVETRLTLTARLARWLGNWLPCNESRVAGWGYTSEAGEPSPYLKVADLPSVGIQQCLNETSFAFKVYITVDKICAGYSNGTATVCKGDSGGGLSFPEQENGVTKYYLRGIVSTAPADGLTCNTITLTTFTHVASHNNFIKSYFENSDRGKIAKCV